MKSNASSHIGLALAAITLLSACSTPGPRERDAINLALYSAHAGDPVDSFHLRNLRDWVSLGETHVAVHTGHNQAWLLSVEQPCPGLEFAQTLGLSSTTSRVHARFDRVQFEHQSCRIREIRPVDIRALREQRRQTSALRS